MTRWCRCYAEDYKQPYTLIYLLLKVLAVFNRIVLPRLHDVIPHQHYAAAISPGAPPLRPHQNTFKQGLNKQSAKLTCQLLARILSRDKIFKQGRRLRTSAVSAGAVREQSDDDADFAWHVHVRDATPKLRFQRSQTHSLESPAFKRARRTSIATSELRRRHRIQIASSQYR
ncbi:hypothetical protein ACN47E_004571 [Coniothyrium glycines]